MARTALVVKTARRKEAHLHALSVGKDPKFPTRTYNRCKVCGRVKGFMRRFDMCRICFRENAREGKIMGVKKSSW